MQSQELRRTKKSKKTGAGVATSASKSKTDKNQWKLWQGREPDPLSTEDKYWLAFVFDPAFLMYEILTSR